MNKLINRTQLVFNTSEQARKFADTLINLEFISFFVNGNIVIVKTWEK